MEAATTFVCNLFLLADFVITIVETFIGRAPVIAENPTALVWHILCTIQANIRIAKGALKGHLHLVKAPFLCSSCSWHILVCLWLHKNVFIALGTKVQMEVSIRMSPILLVKGSFHSGKRLPAGASKIDIKSIYKCISKLSWKEKEGLHDLICG